MFPFALSWPIFQYADTLISHILLRCTLSVILKNIAFIQVYYQTVLHQLALFKLLTILTNLFESLHFCTFLKRQSLTPSPKLYCFLRLMWVVSFSSRTSDICSLIRIQFHPSFIAEYDSIPSICIP